MREAETKAERKESDIRRRILMLVGEAIDKIDLRHASVESICAKIGISPEEFRQYFKNRDDLIDALLLFSIAENTPPHLLNELLFNVLLLGRS